DGVALNHQRQSSASSSFGRDVPNHHSIGRTREATVSYQPYGITQACTNDCRSGRQHLSHARSTFWPFVTNHNYIAGLYVSRQDRLETSLLRVKDSSGTSDLFVFDARDFCNSTLSCKIAS